MPQPLGGVRVLDVATVLAAPLTASLLAEFGAEVIKIELPGHGDPARSYAPYYDDESLHWRVTGRNKKSVTLNLSSPAGTELLYKLVKVSDIVVTNFRPETLASWNIDYADLVRVKPDIIMYHLTAFGRTGPYANRPGFARIAEAISGLTYITGYADRPPVFAGYPIADGVAGMYGAYSVLLALRQRDLTGAGQLVDLALYEPVLRMMEDFIVDYSATGSIKQRRGNEQNNICPNNIYPTADERYVVLPISTESMWSRLVGLIGRADIAVYHTNRERLHHRAEIDEAISAFTRRYTLDKLLALFEERGIACGKLYSAKEIFEDPQIRERGNLTEIYDPDLKRNLTVQAPIPRISNVQPCLTAAPRLGEHNNEIYRKLLGIDQDALDTYRTAGVI